MKKRLISTLLALCMVLGMLPGEAFAAGNDSTSIEPTVTELTVTYKDGESNTTQSLLPLTSTLLQINMPEDGKLTFEAKFDHSEIVDKVYITSSRGADVKRVQAYYNPNTGTYITDAEEHFDPNDPYYIPGEIGVEYTKKQVAVTEDGIVGNTELAVLSDLLQGKGFKLADLVSEDDSVRANLFLNEVDQGLSMLFSELSSSAGIDNAEVEKWAGVYNKVGEIISHDLEGADGENYTVYLDYDENEAFLIILRNITENKYTKFLIQKTDSTLDLDDISDSLSAVNTTATILYDYYGISKEMNDLRKEIENSNTMTISEREEANKKIDALEKDKKWFMVGTTFIPLLLGSAAAVGTGGASLLFSALVGSITVASDYFWEHRVGMIQGCEPVEDVFFEDGEHPSWTAINAQYLWDNGSKIKESGRYYIAKEEIGGLAVLEGLNVTLCLHGHTLGGIGIGKNTVLKICDCKYTEKSDGTITGGIISRPITIESGGELTIDGGIIQGNYSHAIVSKGANGKITINGGVVEGVGGSIIADDGGNSEITINGGVLRHSSSMGGGIRVNNGSKLSINAGIINAKNAVHTYDPNGNSNATVQIDGGEITGSISAGIGRVTVNMKSGSISGDISGGTVNFKKGTCSGYVRGDNVTIAGGEVKSIYGENIVIEDGTISDGASFGDYGPDGKKITVIINGGTIYRNSSTGAGLHSYRSSELTINGGTVYGGITKGENSRLTVTNGTIYGGIEDSGNAKTTLLLQNGTNIQISGTPAFNKVPTVKADTDYTGDVTYISSPGTQGVKMTIQEAANIDYTQSYVCLMADGVTDRPSSGEEPGGCEHSYSSVTINPTCTERGYTAYTCSKCGNSYTDSYVNALGHSYGRWIIVQEATETHTGLRERSCEVCGDVQSETIPRLDTEPSEPSRPSKPDEKPSGAGKPTEPEDPAEPETPAVPETPVRPEEPVVSAPVYDDVAPGAWYNEAAAYVASKGLMTGTGENIFSPNEQMTRAMVWTVLGRIAGADVDGSGSLWYSKAQAWAAANNVSDGTNPTGSISRQELMTMLWRYTGSPAATADLSKFSDSESVADWADAAMQWAISTGLIVGDNGRLNPTGDARRCEVAAIFMRFCENIAE